MAGIPTAQQVADRLHAVAKAALLSQQAAREAADKLAAERAATEKQGAESEHPAPEGGGAHG
jgi:hypothetical protein